MLDMMPNEPLTEFNGFHIGDRVREVQVAGYVLPLDTEKVFEISAIYRVDTTVPHVRITARDIEDDWHRIDARWQHFAKAQS